MDFKKLPKIELHCHLDGSLRPETVIDIAKRESIEIPSYDVENIKTMLSAPLECNSLVDYLKTFSIPVDVMQSRESLERVTFELLEDMAKENVKYVEVRFAPLLHTKRGLTIEQVIQSVLYGIEDAENAYDIKGNLIIGCMRDSSLEDTYKVIEAGKKYLEKGVVAIDLCGREDESFCESFIEPITLAREYGYRATIHAGETGFGKNVLDAVEMLKAERIGHGVFIKDHFDAYSIVKEKGIVLEMCPTSNIQTKAVGSYKEHPIYNFYKDGIKVTVNTDNRTVSNIDLSNEYRVILNEFGLTYEDYKELYYNSVNASFASEEVKKKLKADFIL